MNLQDKLVREKNQRKLIRYLLTNSRSTVWFIVMMSARLINRFITCFTCWFCSFFSSCVDEQLECACSTLANSRAFEGQPLCLKENRLSIDGIYDVVLAFSWCPRCLLILRSFLTNVSKVQADPLFLDFVPTPITDTFTDSQITR